MSHSTLFIVKVWSAHSGHIGDRSCPLKHQSWMSYRVATQNQLSNCSLCNSNCVLSMHELTSIPTQLLDILIGPEERTAMGGGV